MGFNESLGSVDGELLLEVCLAFLCYVEFEECHVDVSHLVEEKVRVGGVQNCGAVLVLGVLAVDAVDQVRQEYRVLRVYLGAIRGGLIDGQVELI